MNETNFASYDNFFATPNNQVSIDSVVLHNMEYEMAQTTVHNYMTNVSCDLPLSSSSADQRHGHTNCFPFHAQPREEQDNLKDPVTNLCVTTSSGTVSGTSSGVHAHIPFVQIHTTDVLPQRTSYGNVFRRNISKQEEIKSEPIKSESADAAKERTNATPTPPRAPSSTQNPPGVASANNIQRENVGDDVSHCQIYKCSKCPYLALAESEKNNHLATQHGRDTKQEVSERAQMNCPGCSNIFFVQESLKVHLKLDHFLSEDDALRVTRSLTNIKTQEPQSKTKDCSEPSSPTVNDDANKEPQRKSRIYLKNVDCLREPNRQPIEQTENQLSEHNQSTNNNQIKQPPKQKISIKSVDVLREPALLRRNYEMENVAYNNFINVNENMNNQIPLNVSTTFNYGQNTDALISNTCNLNDSLNLTDANNGTAISSVEKPRRPKIYVKSVESFNLMPLDSLHSSNNDFLGDHNNLCNGATSQPYEANVAHLPYLYESNAPANNITNTGNYINNHNDMDAAYQYINNSTQSAGYMLESPMYVNVHTEGVDINTGQMENETIITEPTPPPPNPITVGDVIFNGNKSPHPIIEQRGTLHLRTVDELNLMNKNEVQHLIAPQLDNNHVSESSPEGGAQSIGLNNVDFIGDPLYETDSFKFQDLDSQMVNDWPEAYEDLDEDIGGILTDVATSNFRESSGYNAENSQKISYSNMDIDTPQVSMITIRDIEELTGGGGPVSTVPHYNNCVADHQTQEPVVEEITLVANEPSENIDITQNITLNLTTPPPIENSENLKRELANSTPEANNTPVLTTKKSGAESSHVSAEDNNIPLPSIVELPPLVPVTSSQTSASGFTSNNEISVPPLVPVPPLIKINKSIAKPPPISTSPAEKGRIYVANNLMEPSKRPVAVSATCGTSVRGRPFGSNRTRITQLKQQHGSSAEDLFVKCSLKGCAFRFKLSETLLYHMKCHDASSSNPQATVCPECKSTDFNNWNTLHTHLWRAHHIDMELYKCELCEFRTPIFSRLANTHAKIHFDDRNYKCDQCGKGFKNSKQLKNHRRWHRVQAANTAAPKELPTEIHRCADCGSTFSQQKTLREHCCKNNEASLKCDICQRCMSTKASLKLHLLTHSDGEKRYKCQQCDYATNDHNAFRRHRMSHENKKMYECQFCEYKSVQSVAYQKHVQLKHPDKADTVIYKCNECSFSTINRSLLVVHQAKHNKVKDDTVKTNNQEESPPLKSKEIPKTLILELQKSKIKVKSNLFTTNCETSAHLINEFDSVQLYSNSNSNGVT